MFEALARVVLTVDQPVLLLIDDLQWCDRDTLEWLHFLLRYERHARLLIVGTVRIEELTTDDQPLLALVQALRRENRAAEISLNPLSREDTTELAGRVTGRALSPERGDYLYQETEGNPLFVVEMLRSPIGIDPLESVRTPFAVDALELPPSVRAVVTRRLSQLSPQARAILEVAAVIGRSFTFGVIARAVEVDEDAVVRGLDELWQRLIVREQDSDAYDFTHGKLHAVAYAGLSAARKRVLHRQVAEALEGEYAANVEAASGQIALHYERAGLPTQAVSHYRRAAAYARHVYANDVAIADLQRALALVGEQQPERADLCDQLGDLLHFVGRYEEARDAWLHALDVTPALDRIARAHLYRKLGNAWRDQYHYAEAQNAYDVAEAVLPNPQNDDREAVWFCWVEINLERINVLYWLGQIDEMLRLIQHLRPVIEQHGSIIQRAHFHQVSGAVLHRVNRYSPSPEVIEHSCANLKLLDEAGEVGALPAAHFQLGFHLIWASDDLVRAEQEIQTALALARRNGDISLQGRCLTYLAVIARLRGELEETRDYEERSLHDAEAGQMYPYIGAAHGNLAWCAWRKQDYTAARAHGQQALEAWNRLPAGYMFEWIGRLPLIGLALADDNVTEALMHARRLLHEQQKLLPPPVESALNSAVRASEHPNECSRWLQLVMESAQGVGYL